MNGQQTQRENVLLAIIKLDRFCSNRDVNLIESLSSGDKGRKVKILHVPCTLLVGYILKISQLRLCDQHSPKITGYSEGIYHD